MAATESPSTDPDLLRLLASGADADAWCTFVETYTPLIEECCRRAGLQSADADEVRSRVLAVLLTALREFCYDPARRFRGYLSTAVRNAIRSFWRERARRPGALGSGDPSVQRQLNEVEAPDPVARLADEIDDSVGEELRRAQRVMDRVRALVQPDTWESYWRTAIQGEPAAEVARSLGKSVATVYVARSRVGKMLLAEGRHAAAEPSG